MKRHLIVIVCLLTWFCSTHAADGAELRTWTSKSGKFTVKAEFLSFSEGVVNLQRADGKNIKVPLAKLSKKDQNYVVVSRRPKIDPVKALEKLGARIERNEQDDVVRVNLMNTEITDAGLVHLAGLTKLELFDLAETKITDAGVAELKKSLPNCRISH